MRWKKALFAVAVGLVAVGAAVPLVVTSIERRQAEELQDRLPYASPAPNEAGGAAVIYFSRSGNTALAARHLARRLGAALFELRAPDYVLGLTGWASAMVDARGRAADISPRTIDLSPFDTIYLGSPIWLYSPAPPIWAFVENNRFDGRRVVLFNTMNSKFAGEYIEAFRAEVLRRGARRFEHRFVRRGRMTNQLEPDEMLGTIDVEWHLDEP